MKSDSKLAKELTEGQKLRYRRRELRRVWTGRKWAYMRAGLSCTRKEAQV